MVLLRVLQPVDWEPVCLVQRRHSPKITPRPRDVMSSLDDGAQQRRHSEETAVKFGRDLFSVQLEVSGTLLRSMHAYASAELSSLGHTSLRVYSTPRRLYVSNVS